MAAVRHLGLFPFCVAHDASTSNSVDFWQNFGDAEASAALYWRVKEFRVNFNSGYARFYSTLKNEDELVCLRNSSAAMLPTGVEQEESLDEPAWRYDATGGITVLSQSVSYFRPVIYKRHSKIYLWAFAVSIADINNAGHVVIGVNYDVTGTLTLPIELTSGVVFNYSNIGQANSLNLSVYEYWPYDPGDGGGPIYDSTTGAQLRAFPAN